MRGGHEHRVGSGLRERVHVDPLLVDGDRHRLQPAAGDEAADDSVARILDADAPPAVPRQYAAE